MNTFKGINYDNIKNFEDAVDAGLIRFETKYCYVNMNIKPFIYLCWHKPDLARYIFTKMDVDPDMFDPFFTYIWRLECTNKLGEKDSLVAIYGDFEDCLDFLEYENSLAAH